MMDRPLVDPSHLLALHVLLQERHVTRAAARLGVTQSSMSHRLAGLRESLGDPLLVRTRGGLVPTSRALALAAPLADALAALAAAVAPATPFSPATCRLALRVVLPDLLAPVAARVVAAVSDRAPGITLRLEPVPHDLRAWLSHDTPSLSLIPAHFVDDATMTITLGKLRFGVAARRGHPVARGKLTVARWLAHGHVVVRTGNDGPNAIESALARRRLERTIGLEVPSFLMGLFALETSDLLMNVPLPLARSAARSLGLVLRTLPIDVSPVRFVVAWHPRFQNEPAHAWARERIVASLRTHFVP